VVTWSPRLRRQALDHLDRVGLGDQAFQRADTLSGGQQQRVALARTLMQGPSLVLADEPVASLDPENAGSVMDLLFRVCREDQLTVLCTLHQVDLAVEWADRLIGLRDGVKVLDQRADDTARDDGCLPTDRCPGVGPGR
jgi:phosphonate transport system ATP-binding protein